MFNLLNITIILSTIFGILVILSIYGLIKQKGRIKSYQLNTNQTPSPQQSNSPTSPMGFKIDTASFNAAFNNLPILNKLDQMTTELYLASKFENQDMLKSLIDIATEVWQIQKRTEKMGISSSDDVRQRGIEISLGKISAVLSNNNIKTLDYTGQKYSEGMNGIEIISREQSASTYTDIIQDTLEPGIELCGVLHKKAKVTILSPL